MDPLSALSVASNVIQFVDFGCKLVSQSRQIYKSTDGVLSDKVLVEVLALDLDSLSTNLQNCLRENQAFNATTGQTEYSEDDMAIDDLCRRCHGIAQKLISRLNMLKVSGSSTHRNWESFKKALRASWSREEMDSLAAQLHEVRSEIEFRVLLSFRGSLKTLSTQQSQISHELTQSTQTIITTFLSIRDEFANELQRQAGKLAELQGYEEGRGAEQHGTLQTVRHQDDEQDGTAPASIEVSARAIQVEQEMTLLMIENGILGSLDFASIRDRHEDVEIAHNQTFEWIYKDSTGDGTWDSFGEWLRNDSGLYWINGKAGSGKSTLMKYIYDHPQTRFELKKWAGNSTCDISGFFFWNSGSEGQRSQHGLLRTLLFETLQSHRELLPVVLPTQWESWSAKVRSAIKLGTVPSKASLLSQEPKPWNLSQLKRAFRTLIQKCLSSDIKLCYFIDGLDEYDGDYDDIAEYFLGFAHEFGIKICLSSRPLVVFEEAFSEFPGLKLQSLTHNDISCYVENKLGSHRHMARLSLRSPEDARQLITEIVTKASGVFLWVKLVVKSLLQGLRDQNRISDLQKRLRHLPADLEALYEHMLERTDPFYLEQAAQIFQIVLVAQKESNGRQITLLQLSWAQEEDELVAINASLRSLTSEEIAGRCKLMDSRLKSVCSGLLESYDSKHSHIAPDARVVFLHRTVSDFFKKPSVWNKIVVHTQGSSFSPHLSLCRSCVLQLKALKIDSFNALDMSIIRDALNYYKQAEDDLNIGFPLLLDQLDAAASYQWRMSYGKGIGGRFEKRGAPDQAENNLPGSELRKPEQKPTIELESDSDSDGSLSYLNSESKEKNTARPSSHKSILFASQPMQITPRKAEGDTHLSTLINSVPHEVNQSHKVTRTHNLEDFRPSGTSAGAIPYWTYGIEFPGIKPPRRTMPFYDLAFALGFRHYIADKDKSGLVVDHDVNHHLLIHTVTCYSRTGPHSKVPDFTVVERSLKAGADPNFAFHGSTAWEETLTGVLAHLTLREFDEELRDKKGERYKKWEEDAVTWAEIMRVFMGNGASVEALSKQHWGQARRKPLAIVQRFPEALSSRRDELFIIIKELIEKSVPKEVSVDGSEQEETSLSKLEAGSVNRSEPQGTTYRWLFSWLTVGKSQKG